MTDAERRLWWLLRDRRLVGEKFRRQHPFGPYVLDFYCERLRLAIEIDGAQHVESEKDQRRTAWLAEHGCTMVRFWNNDVLKEPKTVLTAIVNATAAIRAGQTVVEGGGPTP